MPHVQTSLFRGNQDEVTAADLKAWLEHVPDRAVVRAGEVEAWLISHLTATWDLGDAP